MTDQYANDPEKLRREIEQTRARMSYDVNALADEANPKHVAQRQVDRAKDSLQSGVQNVKEKIMGSSDEYDYRYSNQPSAGDRIQGAANDAQHAVAGAANDVQRAVQQAPYQVKRQTRGNPLAAGLIAFGLGALLGSLMPVTDAERELSRTVKDKAEPLVEGAREMAQQAADELKPAAEQAVENVKQQATDGVSNVKSDADEARSDVQAQAQHSKDNVQQQAKNQ